VTLKMTSATPKSNSAPKIIKGVMASPHTSISTIFIIMK
jgi:hypothetical protein